MTYQNQQPTERIVQHTVQVPVERVVHQEINPVVAQAVEPSHWSKWWWLPLLLLGLLSSILWHGCRTHDVIANTTETIHVTETVQHQAAPVETVHEEVTETVEATETITIAGEATEAQAREIALSHVGEGSVTHIGRETDHGAMWEVEVTRPNGREIDVYVAADGRVVHTVER